MGWAGMNDSLNEDEWMIHWINMNEWCDKWTVKNDLMYVEEWRICWMNRNEEFIEWTMNGTLDDQRWMIQ